MCYFSCTPLSMADTTFGGRDIACVEYQQVCRRAKAALLSEQLVALEKLVKKGKKVTPEIINDRLSKAGPFLECNSADTTPEHRMPSYFHPTKRVGAKETYMASSIRRSTAVCLKACFFCYYAQKSLSSSSHIMLRLQLSADAVISCSNQLLAIACRCSRCGRTLNQFLMAFMAYAREDPRYILLSIH